MQIYIEVLFNFKATFFQP